MCTLYCVSVSSSGASPWFHFLTALKIDGAHELQPGNSLNFFYPTDKDTAILIRAADGQYYAYGQKCTHLTCPVYYSKDHNSLECPCHEGGIDVKSGDVVSEKPVHVKLLDGTLDGNRMEIIDSGDLVRFDGGVKMLLNTIGGKTPGQAASDTQAAQVGAAR